MKFIGKNEDKSSNQKTDVQLGNSDTKINWSYCTLIFLSISDTSLFLLTLAQSR